MSDNKRDYDLVKNWGLKCFEMKVGEKGITLNCSKSGVKKKDQNGNVIQKDGKDVYAKSQNIRVFCGFEDCEIAEDDYANTYINVDGFYMVDDWTDKDGVTHPSYTIFASKVTKREFNRK